MNFLARNILYGALGVVLLAGVVSVLVFYQLAHFSDVRVVFLDVGQGDAILITEGDHQILIDGGPDGRRLQEQLSRYMPFWDRTIDLVIATHPDSDHIDGLVAVFQTYQVATFWQSTAVKDTDVAQALQRVAGREGAQIATPAYGDTATFPSGAALRVLYPISQEHVSASDDDANAQSITTLLSVGAETFFLGGDLPLEIEDALSLDDAPITVLKAGHHGSKTSTSQIFMERVRPRDMIISAGKDNRYGHPHAEVLTRAVRVGARVFRTDTDGSIIYTCGETCTISFEKR